MGFLRRLLGAPSAERDSPEGAGDEVMDDAAVDAAEQAYQRDLLRGEQERMTELTRRQLRYADHAWRPPDQGGPRRSDDAGEGSEGG